MPFSSSQVCNRQAGAGTLFETRPRGRKLNKTGRPLPITGRVEETAKASIRPSERAPFRPKEPWDDDPPMMKKSDVA